MAQADSCTLPHAVMADVAKSSAARITQELTWHAALRAERLISRMRIVFCAAILARFFMLDVEHVWQSRVSEVLALVTGMLYSLYMLRAIRAGTVSKLALQGSVVFDALICFGSLLQTVLWPSSLPYRGILAQPDTTAMLVVICCAGYRLSVSLAVLSGILNALALAALVCIERTRYADTLAHGWLDVFLFVSVLACAAVLGVAIARRTAQLVESGALASFKIDRTRDGLAHVLLDQHDARNLVNAATLHASLIERALDSKTSSSTHVRTLTERLVEDLALASHYLRTLGDRTYGQFAGLQELAVVNTEQALCALATAAGHRFPGLSVHTPAGELPFVLIVGGRASLERVLFNLVANAAQGDGRSCARTVWITTQLECGSTRLSITVADDGPGFDQTMLEETRAASLSGKRDGSGLGLVAIKNIVEQSGGVLRASNTEHGASVVLELHALHPSMTSTGLRLAARALV